MLLEKLKSKDSVIGIIGLGYVGLPLMLEYIKADFKVIGFDIDNSKIDKLNRGESFIEHILSSSIASAVEKGFLATSDFSKISEVDAIIIAVPTPLDEHREPDLSYVVTTIKSIQQYLRAEQILSLESTTYPGTTEEVLRPLIEERGFKIGEDFYLVYSPEREDPGRKDFNVRTTPKVCGGTTNKCLEVGIALYEGIVDHVVPVSSTQAAELTKVLENTHRAVNIGLVNELKIVADKMGIDIFEVIRAAATKPFGFTAYYPGPGIGGHCIPIDPFYLTWKAREYGVHTRFIELAGEINSSMPDYVVNKVQDALNLNKKSINGSNILILGISYKRNVDDMRESPSVFLMEKLELKGAILAYSDPHVPVFPKMREHHFELESVELNKDSIASYDCVVIATDHEKFDYELIKLHAQLIVDTRGVYRGTQENIIKA